MSKALAASQSPITRRAFLTGSAATTVALAATLPRLSGDAQARESLSGSSQIESIRDRIGLVVNHRAGWPSPDELHALQPRWLRSIVYDLEEFGNALATVPPGIQVIAMLNAQTNGVGAPYEFSGWLSVVREFVRRYAGKVAAVECFNEWDIFVLPPDAQVRIVASLVMQVADTIHSSGMLCLLGSVAGKDPMGSYTTLQAQLPAFIMPYIDGVCFHPYVNSAQGFPMKDPVWPDIVQNVLYKHTLYQKPIWLTEFGIKLSDAGGEAGQAQFLRASYESLAALPAAVLGPACYFCWHDETGAEDERGPHAFGLRSDDGYRPRPSWFAYQELSGGIGAGGPRLW